MGEIYMSGGRRGEAVARNGMRLLRHGRENPDTELCRNLNQAVPRLLDERLRQLSAVSELRVAGTPLPYHLQLESRGVGEFSQ